MTHGAPTSSFMPPYVAHLGWTRVRLDRDLAWECRTVAPLDESLSRSLAGITPTDSSS
jgi:hypothetical protein